MEKAQLEFVPQEMKISVALMTGLGFTFGMLLGLLISLHVMAIPVDTATNTDYVVDMIPRQSSLLLETKPSVIDEGKGLAKHTKEHIVVSNPIVVDNILIPNKTRANSAEHVVIQSFNPIHNSVKNVYIDAADILHAVDGNVKIHLERDAENESHEKPDYDYQSAEGDLLEGGSEPQVSVVLNVNNHVNKPGIEKGLAPSGDSNARLLQHGKDLGKHHKQMNLKSGHEFHRFSSVVKGIYWSKKLEGVCSNGFTDEDYKQWSHKVSETRFVHMAEGCGRMQNRRLTLMDASQACARYRLNTDQIQGEIFSFYLSRLLGINRVPPTALSTIKTKEPQWSTLSHDIARAQWGEDKVVILSQYVNSLTSAFIPKEFRTDDRKLYPTEDIVRQKNTSELCELLQWSDLIIFDYLTANLDRVVNNMFNKQWNDQMMDSPTHNLEKNKDTGSLLFFDNESGLFHSYRLLDKYSSYHTLLLKSLCVFRKSTSLRVQQLYKSDSIGKDLNNLFIQNEALHQRLPHMPEKNIKILQQRLADVYKQIIACQAQYGG